LEFAVNRNVLIPRPETELLAEKAWKLLAALEQNGSPPAVADVGTGSGCLAITLAAKCPTAKLDGLDISADALEVAAGNAARLGVAGRIDFYQSDLFGGIPPGRRFDLVVTNPPYIPTGDIPGLQAEVRDWDPSLALDGGADGLGFYRRLAAETPAHLKSGGVLMAEVGDDQADDVGRCFEQQQWSIDEFVKDLAGKPRIVIARRLVP
jgi:release factor glutamine methyltransferase